MEKQGMKTYQHQDCMSQAHTAQVQGYQWGSSGPLGTYTQRLHHLGYHWSPRECSRTQQSKVYREMLGQWWDRTSQGHIAGTLKRS